MRIAPLVCLLALTSSSCSEDRPTRTAQPGDKQVRRIELLPAGSPVTLSETNVVASFFPGDEQVSWKPLAPTTAMERVVTDENGAECRGLFLGGTEFKRIEIRGSFDPRTFDRVRVVSLQELRVSAGITLAREGRGRCTSRMLRVPGQATATVTEFEFPELWREKEPFDRMSLLFRGVRRSMCLVRIDLVRVPLLARLPDPAGPAELICIGDEWRPARCVSADAPLEATFDVAGCESLRFSYGLPEDVRVRQPRPRLRVELLTEGEESIEQVYALESDPAVDTAWHHASIPLDRLAGDHVRVRFSVAQSPVVLVVGEPVLALPSPDPPTVLLVTSDTHRGDHLGRARDGVEVATPFLDALAERGVLFEDCWTSANSTQPSHAALLTGCTPRETGVVSNEERLSEVAPTLPEVFQSEGFVTWAAVSVGHLGPKMSGLGQGFDRVAAPDTGQRDSRETMAELSSWLPEAQGLPLFVWLHVFDAHSPYEVPRAYERLYYPADKDPRGAELPELRVPRLPYWDETIRDVDWVLAQYKSQITYLDEGLGKFFGDPRISGAIVAVTADHGESLGAHGVHYSHAELYPDSLHVPLVLAWPDAPRGSRVAHPVRQIDVGRTLLDLAGLQERPFPGRNLTQLGTDPVVEPRFALASRALSASVQVGRWLLILNLVDRSHVPSANRALHSIELYDLAADPGGTRELSGTELEQARKLRRLLVDWLAGAPAEHWKDDRVALVEEIAELAELGYASDEGGGQDGLWLDPECGCEGCAAWE